jgi:F-type H+-transporting ATPase subunit epsilon
MASDTVLRCSLITPEEQVLKASAKSLVIPAHDGQIGILRNRAPLLCQLGTGTLRIETVDAGIREFFVDGGFAQVLHNEVTILTERAAAAEKISRPAAEKALAEARQMKNHGVEAVQARRKALDRAKAQLRLAVKPQ